MKVELTISGWIATGRGPIRPIIAEGGTRAEAVFNWTTQYKVQKDGNSA